jgi:hypothetical protein
VISWPGPVGKSSLEVKVIPAAQTCNINMIQSSQNLSYFFVKKIIFKQFYYLIIIDIVNVNFIESFMNDPKVHKVNLIVKSLS